MTAPAFLARGFSRTGPGRIRCQLCDWAGSSNALAWHAHEDACPGRRCPYCKRRTYGTRFDVEEHARHCPERPSDRA